MIFNKQILNYKIKNSNNFLFKKQNESNISKSLKLVILKTFISNFNSHSNSNNNNLITINNIMKVLRNPWWIDRNQMEFSQILIPMINIISKNIFWAMQLVSQACLKAVIMIMLERMFCNKNIIRFQKSKNYPKISSKRLSQIRTSWIKF